MNDQSQTSIANQEQYLEHVAHFIRHMPGIVSLKTIRSEFLSTNQSTAQLFGFKQADDLIGLTDDHLNCPAAEFADTFRIGDRRAMSIKKPQTFLEVIRCDQDQWSVVVIKKSPVIWNGSMLGCCINGYTINHKNMVHSAHLLAQSLGKQHYQHKNLTYQRSYRLGQHDTDNLTVRQHECLFLTLYHKTAKQVADILNIKNRTVESHLESIKNKWGCANKSELTDEAMAKGYLFIIPPSLINQQLSIRLEHV